MRFRFLLPLALVLTLTACSQEAAKSYTDNEEFYTGFRGGFIKSSTQSCLDSAGGDTAEIKALCECASLKLADSITREEIKNASIGIPLPNIEARTQAAVNACREVKPVQ
ncbi:hypothetical protein GJV52_06240 [Neisseria brasiliensis]|uniref:hypothetical protein n=1 Tax=Neisseria TaxID=482 RepID=UPI000C272CCB|nr:MULTISPECIES: hypothetical protein [Neisseria]PJO77164.1 hypothetical protein CWC45_11905 [Neisseria sp. N177_16]QGL25165.1 hypothetical protein GJV52_06240 [Neisseria brasiliensis]